MRYSRTVASAPIGNGVAEASAAMSTLFTAAAPLVVMVLAVCLIACGLDDNGRPYD